MEKIESLGKLFQLHVQGGEARELWIRKQGQIKIALLCFLDSKGVRDQVIQTAKNHRTNQNNTRSFAPTFGGIAPPKLEIQLATKEKCVSISCPFVECLDAEDLKSTEFWESMEFLITDKACLEPFQNLLKQLTDLQSVSFSIREDSAGTKELWLTLGFNLTEVQPKPLPTLTFGHPAPFI